MQEMQETGGLIPESRRSPGEGKGSPLQYSYLENSRDRGASMRGCKELDMTEHATPYQQEPECTHTHTHTHTHPATTTTYLGIK